MPKIICRFEVCVFNRKNMCTANTIEYDPDEGCLTAREKDELGSLVEEEWEEDETEGDAKVVASADGKSADDEFDANDDDDEEEDDAQSFLSSRKRV